MGWEVCDRLASGDDPDEVGTDLLAHPAAAEDIAATAVTADNLNDNLWPEMAKWQKRSGLLTAAFDWSKTRIASREHPETWFMSARTWPRSADATRQADTLAGLHVVAFASPCSAAPPWRMVRNSR